MSATPRDTTEAEAREVDAIEVIAPHVYEAYRIGKYAKREYLPMWHEQEDHRPMLEARQAAEALERAGWISPTEAAARDAAQRAEGAETALREAADEIAANTFVRTDLDVTAWLRRRADRIGGAS